MKLSKCLFLAFASLGLFACSNEDVATENGNNIEGAIVSVNIVTDGSRAGNGNFEKPSTSGDPATKKPVEIKKLVLKLEAGQGSKEIYFPITTPAEAAAFGLTGADYDEPEDEYFTKTALQQANLYKFTGVRQPTKMILSINDGSDQKLNLPSVVSVGLATPMYEAVDITSGMYEEGTNTYKVSMSPAHRLAMLEFSEISHSDNSEGCWFETINFSGLFLNKVKVVEGEKCIDPSAITNWNSARVTYTCHEIPGAEGGVGESFKEVGKKWPAEDGNCYAYNIFPAEGDELPVLTLYFTNIKMAEGKGQWAGQVEGNTGVGYATVKDYILSENSASLKEELGVADDNKITSFKAGYVYRFKGLAVPDEAIGGGIDGGKDVNVVAVVDVLPWTLVDGTVTWN